MGKEVVIGMVFQNRGLKPSSVRLHNILSLHRPLYGARLACPRVGPQRHDGQKQNWHVRLRFSAAGVSGFQKPHSDWGGKLVIIHRVTRAGGDLFKKSCHTCLTSMTRLVQEIVQELVQELFQEPKPAAFHTPGCVVGA